MLMISIGFLESIVDALRVRGSFVIRYNGGGQIRGVRALAYSKSMGLLGTAPGLNNELGVLI